MSGATLRAPRFRRAETPDLEALHALNQSEVPRVGGVGAEHFARLLRLSACAPLVEVEGQLAGFVLAMLPGVDYESRNYLWFQARYRRFIYVDRIVVARDFRRRGLAGMLYDRIAEAGRDAGQQVMVCEYNTRPPNPASRAFHQGYGFREVGAQDTEDGRLRVSLQSFAL